jgi:hypothetical protein
MMILAVLLVALAAATDQFAIDDENPSLDHFCVLDSRTGEPINCRTDDDDDDPDALLRSRVRCTGVELGPLGTSCELRNICYDARNNRLDDADKSAAADVTSSHLI